MKDATRSAAIAGLAVLAVAVAAATLDSTVLPEGGGASGPGGGGGSGDGGLLPPPRTGPPPGETVQVPFLTEVLTALAVVAALAFVAYAFVYRRESLGLVLAGVVLLGLLVLLSQFVSPPARPPSSPPMEPGNGSVLGGGGSSSGSNATRRSPPSQLLLVVFGLALVGAVLAAFRSTSEGEDDDSRGESSRGGGGAAAVGRAAGRAAERLDEEATVDNEVYRTWREMTELLDVDDPDTSTPGEFADAAVEAGLDCEDVDELTRLFEDVRYGAERASDDHERRAVAVFRRIEERYAGGES